jgi:membrane associated rhomboid family serine protease/Tfp pilus assembly protein PilF
MANCAQCGRTLPGLEFGKRLCKWCVQYQAVQRGEVPDDTMQPVMDAPWERRETGPLITHAIFGINVAVFLGMALAGVDILNPPVPQLVHWGANFGPLTLSGQWWRLLTCVFVHGGIIHIALNMWCLWYIGHLAESLYGHVTYAFVYLVAGVGASVASLAWHQNVASVGASGAIFGIAGALIASLKLGNLGLPAAHVKATLSSIVTFAVYNIAFGAVSGITDNAAHIGGLLTGMMLGALIAVAAPGRGQYIRRFLVIVFVLAVVAGGAAWTNRSRAYVVHLQRASQLLGERKTDQAIAEIQTAIRQRPDYIPARLHLAWVYTMTSRFSEAEAELKQVLAQQPNNQSALYQLGDLYSRSKQTEKAKDTFKQLLALNPKSAEAHFGLGYALSADQDDAGAVEEYKQAAKLDPEMEDVHYNLGLCYSRLQHYEEAIAAFKQEIHVSGDSRETEAALADAYKAKGMTKEADEAQAKAAKLKGGSDVSTDPGNH